MHMEPAAQVEGGVPGMGVFIVNRPRCRRARQHTTSEVAHKAAFEGKHTWVDALGNTRQAKSHKAAFEEKHTWVDPQLRP